jgi:hypothetical protein
MRSRAALLALLLAACGGPPIPEADLLLEVSVDRDAVAPGEPFRVEVTRIWRRDLVPDTWQDRALAPLRLRLEDLSTREDEVRVEERRRFSAWWPRRDPIDLPPVAFSATPATGGAAHTVRSAALRVAVETALDPANPGPAEIVPVPPPPARPWPWIVAGATVLLAAAALVLRRRAAPAPGPAPVPSVPDPSPDSVALAELAALRAAARPAGETVVLVAETLRRWIAARWSFPAARRTTEEFLSATLAAPRDAAARRLRAADLVKFAGEASDARAAAEALSDAERIVQIAVEGAGR